ncbi:hypothetical protein EMCRGX_G031631 [Ephydatia muelleri]
MPNFKAEKLKTNLKLCINRLKLLEKKKTEGAMKARKEIADYIKTHRLERARVRVEHIIREDYLVEALEVLELYCDLLLARFGLLEQKAYCDDTLVEAVSTLIWASPRLVADVQEFGIIAHQFEEKFGKEFAHQARSNLSGTVNAKVIHRLGVEPIKKSLIENYLVEIARNYHQEYQPDPSAFLDDDAPPPMDGKPFIPSEEFVQEVSILWWTVTYTRTPTITTRQSSWLAILNGTTTCSNTSTSTIKNNGPSICSKSYVPRASIWGRWGC